MVPAAAGRLWIRVSRRPVTVLAACFLASALPAVQPAGPAHAAEEKPNLVFILTDDQPFRSMGVMPKVRDIFNVRFSRGFVTTPLCCPSRVTYLTGRYAHHHGVKLNGGYPVFQPREADSLGPWLQAQGYYTGFVGKYLNGYSVDHGVPPGWDEFAGLILSDKAEDGYDRYTKFRLRRYRSVGGVEVQNEVRDYADAYSTTEFGELSNRFVERAAASGKPWALFLWPNAPHTPLIPEAKYEDAPLPSWNRPPSFMERNIRDKPWDVRRRIHDDASFHRGTRGGQLRLLMTVDDVVRDVFDKIDALGMRGDTWGIFASDNGYFWGEHRLGQKDFAYEEGARIPFRMAVPGMPRIRIDSIVANIDVAPTLMRLAKDPSSRRYDGRSLVRLVKGKETRVRKALLLEAWRRGHYRGLRNGKWKYVYWVASGRRELYNLNKDRYELSNLIKSDRRAVRRAARRVAKDLHAWMMRIRARPPAAA